jgi:hypothetical protein
MIKTSVLAALIALSLPVASLAETISGSVAAGRSTKVYSFTIADPSNCTSPGKPKMSIRKAPKHGTITFDWGFVPSGKKFQNCAGGRMRAMGIVYTPNKGYRGPDSFSVSYRFPDMGGYAYHGARAQSFDLQVK